MIVGGREVITKEFSRDPLGRDCTEYELARTYTVQECVLSVKIIWPGQRAWKKTYYNYYNSTEAFSHWVRQDEMLFAKIKGTEI